MSLPPVEINFIRFLDILGLAFCSWQNLFFDSIGLCSSFLKNLFSFINEFTPVTLEQIWNNGGGHELKQVDDSVRAQVIYFLPLPLRVAMDSRRSSSPNGRRSQGGVASLEEHSQRHESSAPFSQSSRDCAICADPLPQVQAGLAACGAFPAEHVFCVVCITTAVLSDSRCPLCREELNQVGLVLGDTGETVFPDRSRTNHGELVPPGAEFNFTQELNALSQPMDQGRLDTHVETPPLRSGRQRSRSLWTLRSSSGDLPLLYDRPFRKDVPPRFSKGGRLVFHTSLRRVEGVFGRWPLGHCSTIARSSGVQAPALRLAIQALFTAGGICRRAIRSFSSPMGVLRLNLVVGLLRAVLRLFPLRCFLHRLQGFSLELRLFWRGRFNLWQERTDRLAPARRPRRRRQRHHGSQDPSEELGPQCQDLRSSWSAIVIDG